MIEFWPTNPMHLGNRLLCSFLLLSASAWSSVLVHWTNSALPGPDALGFSELVISGSAKLSPMLDAARKKGYRVYVEVPLKQAKDAAMKAEKTGVAGIILKASQSESTEVESLLPTLRSAHPQLRFLILSTSGKQPQMRGSLVIRRNSVLEVSSPTAQPWIDTNLSLVKIEQRAHSKQAPLYTFPWSSPDTSQQSPPSTIDYSLAVAEAGAFRADLVLEVDEHLQKALAERDPQAWALWKQVKSYADFYSASNSAPDQLANVALVVDDLDPMDEPMNLLARHNIPFKVLLASDLKSDDLSAFELVVMFAKPASDSSERIVELATRGKTVVIVDAKGSYPWQKGDPIPLNENAVSYAVGKGKVIELAESVTDPETFAQDIRRLLGNPKMLVSLWNGLTTIAVPYGKHGGNAQVLELINYATDPIQLQVKVKGEFNSIRFESPGRECCTNLAPVKRDGFTEFVIPKLLISGRVYLDQSGQRNASQSLP